MKGVDPNRWSEGEKIEWKEGKEQNNMEIEIWKGNIRDEIDIENEGGR